jgi:hypothetical protein
MIKYEVIKHEKRETPTQMINQSVNFVVYSHSTFLDILQIQTDHIEGKGHLTLLIDHNDKDLSEYYNRYDNVIFYDSNLPYGRKLLSCIEQLEFDYFVLIHDNDILLHYDNTTVLELIAFLRGNDYDRVDFQLAYDYDSSHELVDDNNLYLIKSDNTDTWNKGYIYNVNPSIWKRDALIDILTRYQDREYRTIEAHEVQVYCLKFNVFKLYAKKRYRCGYFTCLEPFRFLHITHSQKLFSPQTIPSEDSIDIIEDYYKIVDKYNLRASDKWIG